MIYAFISIIVAYLVFCFGLRMGINLFGQLPAGVAVEGLGGSLSCIWLYDYLTDKW